MTTEKLIKKKKYSSRYCKSNRKKFQNSGEGGRVPKALSVTEELLAVDSCWGRESHFSLWEGPGDDSTSTYIWAALIRLSELSRKCTSNWEMFMLEEIQGAGGSWAENF